MKNKPIKTGFHSLGLVFAALVFFLPGFLSHHGSGGEFHSLTQNSPVDPLPVFLAGSGSCSGRACHGSADPKPDSPILRNEYSTWLAHDKHARSFETLLSPRSKRMAENLGILAAHRDLRCLACHGNPGLALPQSLQDSPLEIGIGCESCHGRATSKWLGLHTTPSWKNPQGLSKSQQYQKEGMNYLGDAFSQATVCVGCHVGAPADPENGLPARDLNHDLMAAGHPRLTFETFSHLANMPPHWNVKKYDSQPQRDLETWFAGQLATGQAMAGLLAYRAEKAQKDLAPWPEFADFSCLACHADFQSPSWRNSTKYLQGRKPGSSFLSPWTRALLPEALGISGVDATASLAALNQLIKEMRGYQPEARKVAPAAGKLAEELDKSIREIRQRSAVNPYGNYLGLPVAPMILDSSAGKQLLEQLKKKDISAVSWDESAQIYLALRAIARAEGKGSNPEPWGNIIFPLGFEGPVNYQPNPDQIRKALNNLLAP
ncbi:MAG: hypothetical protein EXR99_06050 [Gemmataceae bacterium]|nr:hypothetical protein [Gemmataceae bacterium]